MAEDENLLKEFEYLSKLIEKHKKKGNIPQSGTSISTQAPSSSTTSSSHQSTRHVIPSTQKPASHCITSKQTSKETSNVLSTATSQKPSCKGQSISHTPVLLSTSQSSMTKQELLARYAQLTALKQTSKQTSNVPVSISQKPTSHCITNKQTGNVITAISHKPDSLSTNHTPVSLSTKRPVSSSTSQSSQTKQELLARQAQLTALIDSQKAAVLSAQALRSTSKTAIAQTGKSSSSASLTAVHTGKSSSFVGPRTLPVKCTANKASVISINSSSISDRSQCLDLKTSLIQSTSTVEKNNTGAQAKVSLTTQTLSVCAAKDSTIVSKPINSAQSQTKLSSIEIPTVPQTQHITPSKLVQKTVTVSNVSSDKLNIVKKQLEMQTVLTECRGKLIKTGQTLLSVRNKPTNPVNKPTIPVNKPTNPVVNRVISKLPPPPSLPCPTPQTSSSAAAQVSKQNQVFKTRHKLISKSVSCNTIPSENPQPIHKTNSTQWRFKLRKGTSDPGKQHAIANTNYNKTTKSASFNGAGNVSHLKYVAPAARIQAQSGCKSKKRRLSGGDGKLGRGRGTTKYPKPKKTRFSIVKAKSEALPSSTTSVDVNKLLGRKVSNASRNKFKFVNKPETKQSVTMGKGTKWISPAASAAAKKQQVMKNSMKSTRARAIADAPRVSVRGVIYIKTKSGRLVREHNTRANTRARQSIQRSIWTAAAASRRKTAAKDAAASKYCKYYNRYAKCNRGGKCPYVHDPGRVAVCSRFLRGTCTISKCPFSHRVSAGKVPTCRFFLRGTCTTESCPYLHVNVGRNAEICPHFLDGLCPKGDKCQKSHNPVCGEFDTSGKCTKGNKCRLLHEKRRIVTPQKRKHEDNSEEQEEQEALLPPKRLKEDVAVEYDDDLPMGERSFPSFICFDRAPSASPASSHNFSPALSPAPSPAPSPAHSSPAPSSPAGSQIKADLGFIESKSVGEEPKPRRIKPGFLFS